MSVCIIRVPLRHSSAWLKASYTPINSFRSFIYEQYAVAGDCRAYRTPPLHTPSAELAGGVAPVEHASWWAFDVAALHRLRYLKVHRFQRLAPTLFLCHLQQRRGCNSHRGLSVGSLSFLWHLVSERVRRLQSFFYAYKVHTVGINAGFYSACDGVGSVVVGANPEEWSVNLSSHCFKAFAACGFLFHTLLKRMCCCRLVCVLLWRGIYLSVLFSPYSSQEDIPPPSN